jgi:Tfp pilus assembly protein PilF
VIALNPEYAEVWNQRATVYFHRAKHEVALVDVAKALVLEPRHFGAFAGRAINRLQQLKPVIARSNNEEALKLLPYLLERHYVPDLVH